MPIPIDSLERAIIPRVLTPATTVEELLYLFKEQPEPRRCYAVVRVSADAYDVLTLDDLCEVAWPQGNALLPMALGALPGLLKPAAPVRQDRIGEDAADRKKNAAPRRRLVVLDADGAVLGCLTGGFLSGVTGTDLLALITPEEPAVLGMEETAPPSPTPANLNTRFEGLGANQPLTVGRRVPLIVSVGAPTASDSSQSSRPFTFTFPDASAPVSFTVQVDADPEAWTIKAVEQTMIVAPPGTTKQEAEFLVTARQPGRDKLHISVERADTGVTVQHIWLPVVAAAEDAAPTPQPVASGRSEAILPLDTAGVERRTVEITIQPGEESFVAVVRADLPGGSVRDTYRVPVNGVEIQNAALRLRQELEKIVFYRADNGSIPFASKQTLSVDEAIARKATVSLADAGEQVWHLLFNAARAPEGLKQFAADLRGLPQGSTLQVVLDSQEFIIPWSLLYDKPGPINAETLDWSGFWGYRYILDTLPPGRYPPPAIADTPLCIQLLLNDDANLRTFTNAQEQFVRSELSAAQATVAWGDTAIQQALMAPCDAALIYFYCHGDHESGAAPNPNRDVTALASESALNFGGQARMRLADLRRLPAAPLARRPLVFLNACEGATQDAFYYDGFMPYFIEEQGARGFIGTEVKAPQLLAHDFALQFLRAFAQGQPVGEILWRLRRFYLDTHHTILGFNYSLYCLGDVRLAKPLLATP